ncbi:MAG: glycosyltransferase family 2 protein [Gammaproteobacteria bacterium]|nr:glycosyltransferase family 2 protein [Gammaproteobacteria bacterium]
MTLPEHHSSHQQRVAIIVLNWNAPDDTIACLDSLTHLTGDHSVTLVVCDNHSNDDSVNQIKDWASQHFHETVEHSCPFIGFALFQLNCNSGYAAGNNVGLQFALDHQFDFVWILNNDTVVEPDALTALLQSANLQPNVGCWGSTLVDADHPDIVQCAGGCRYNPLTTVRTELLNGIELNDAQQHDPGIKLDYVCGASMFLRVEALRETGLLNPQFFLYYEELDLARRLETAGYQLGWCRASIVRHRQFDNKSNTTKQLQVLHYHENLSTLIYTWLHNKPLFPVSATFRFFVKLIVLPTTSRSSLIASLMRSYLDFFVRIPQLNRTSMKQPKIIYNLYLQITGKT